MKTFSSIMNIECLSSFPFKQLNKKVMLAYKTAAEGSMKNAAKEAPTSGYADSIPCTRVSIDGSWQKRGHSSLHGVVTSISGDKCIDIEIKSKHCFGCKMWERKKGTPKYEIWKLEHNCQINHEKSSGAMESSGAVDIFNRSIAKHNLIYKEYLGDGDTSSFNDVIKSNPYKKQDVLPIKLECIGHVQKRLGTWLRNLVKSYKGTKTPVSGKGKLTNKCIDSMQNYYGIAIRSNITSIYAMKKAIYAILFHFTDFSDSYERHKFCPRETGSWCKYWSKGQKDYKPSNTIPFWIKTKLQPIFEDLMSDKLLSKCLHGKTQNANEALNGIIWSRVPKTVFVARETVEMGAHSAVIHYNDGRKGVLNVLQYFGLQGSISKITAEDQDNSRVIRMNKKSSDASKKRRKGLRAIKKGFDDKLNENEPVDSYEAGAY